MFILSGEKIMQTNIFDERNLNVVIKELWSISTEQDILQLKKKFQTCF